MSMNVSLLPVQPAGVVTTAAVNAAGSWGTAVGSALAYRYIPAMLQQTVQLAAQCCFRSNLAVVVGAAVTPLVIGRVMPAAVQAGGALANAALDGGARGVANHLGLGQVPVATTPSLVATAPAPAVAAQAPANNAEVLTHAQRLTRAAGSYATSATNALVYLYAPTLIQNAVYSAAQLCFNAGVATAVGSVALPVAITLAMPLCLSLAAGAVDLIRNRAGLGETTAPNEAPITAHDDEYDLADDAVDQLNDAEEDPVLDLQELPAALRDNA